ncbi:hypothetical protein JCM9279_006741 [Rhodotorula babjevae]
MPPPLFVAVEPPSPSPEPASASFPSAPSTSDAAATPDPPPWAALVHRYDDGTCATDMEAAPVERPKDFVFDGGESSAGSSPPPSVPLDGADVDFAREFYKREGYLPAIRSPREQERRRVLRRYSLYEVGRIPAIDELASLARDVFDVDAVVINVVLDDRVLLVSTSGWDANERDPDAPQAIVPLTASFCPHGMAKPRSAGCFQIPNTTQDWRFRRSPLVQEGDGRIQFFASSNIYLPTSSVEPAPAEADADALPVGSLCLIHETPRPKLTERQERMLKQFAVMAAKEFELAFEQHRRRATDGQQDYLRDVLNSLIVWPSRNLVSSATALPCNFSGTATELHRWTGSDFAFVLDLRGFNHSISDITPPPSPASSTSQLGKSRPTSAQSGRPTPPASPNALTGRDEYLQKRKSSAPHRRDAKLHGPGFVSIMDIECGESGAMTASHKKDWEAVVNSSSGVNSIAQALADWHKTGQIAFSAALPTSANPHPALATPLLGILAPDVKAVVAVPVFDHEGEPAIYVVVGSRKQHFQYETTDQRFVQSVGALLVAGMLQERILAADKAKQAFLSQVSHELRTPMFAIGSQLELIRTMTEPSALASIDPLLDVAEICLTSLREVLDDTLDVSKLNNGSQVAASLVEVDLESLVIDVVKSCWHKAKRLAALRSEDDGQSNSSAVEKVDVMLRTSLAPGVKAKVDVGGLKRVLINLFGNALKFTCTGSITLVVAPEGIPCTDGARRIRFEVEDTGKGMSQEFLRDHLFVAFRQEDSFTNGAGLGVSIAESIVKRMGGTLRYKSAPGVGTTATVIVPLEGVTATDSSKDLSKPVTRNLSEELTSLFDPQSRTPSSSAEPEDRPSVAEASDRVEDEERTGSLAQGAKKTLVSGLPGDKPADSSAAQQAPSPARVLVVDDNPIARRILATFLKTKKITYAEASGGAQAIERFKEFRPNLVWCDIQMPEVDGVQATREMREYEREEDLARARIVAISGLDSTLGDHPSVMTSGQIDHWLVKSGSSLRALAADLADYTKKLVESKPDGEGEPSAGAANGVDGASSH